MCYCDTAALAQTLHFKSGFDPGSIVVNPNGVPPLLLSTADQIIGLDEITGFDWAAHMNPPATTIGDFRFATQGDGAHPAIVDDPTNQNRGKVLRFWLSTPTHKKGRVQSNVYDAIPTPALEEMTSIVRMYLHPSLATMKDIEAKHEWFTIQELWTNPIFSRTTGYNFRITLGLGKEAGAGQKLYWLLHADESGNGDAGPYWEDKTSGRNLWASDVIGQWVTLVMYYKKGKLDDKNTAGEPRPFSKGRIRLKIIKENGAQQTLFDITNYTSHPDDVEQQEGLTDHNPHKLYTAASTVDWIREHSEEGAAIIYWDDWQYYQGDKYSNYMPAPFGLKVTSVASNQINLSWKNIPNETGFTIERATNPNFTTGRVPSSLGADVVTFNSTGLAANTVYYYRVHGTNATAASDWSDVVSAKTGSSAAPTVALTLPLDETGVMRGVSTTIRADAVDSDGSIAKVSFYVTVGGSTTPTLIGEDSTSPYSVAWTPSAMVAYNISAVATDNAGIDSIPSVVRVIARERVTFISSPSNDGWLLGNGETNVGQSAKSSESLRVGDTAGNLQYKLLVSFDTTSALIPSNAVIVSACLKLKRNNSAGNAKPLGDLFLDIKDGSFGNAGLQASDFQAAASKDKVTIMRYPMADGDLSLGYLDVNSFGKINRNGTVELRGYFETEDFPFGSNNNGVGDWIGFYSGEAAVADRPVLEVIYQMP